MSPEKLREILTKEEYEAVLKTATAWGIKPTEAEFIPFCLCQNGLNRVESAIANFPKISEEISENFSKNAADSVKNINDNLRSFYEQKSVDFCKNIEDNFFKNLISINNNVVEVNRQIINHSKNQRIALILQGLTAFAAVAAAIIAFKLKNY